MIGNNRSAATKMITMTRASRPHKTERPRADAGPTPQPMDRLLFLLMLMLIGVGIVTVYDASYALAVEKGDSFHFVKRQALLGRRRTDGAAADAPCAVLEAGAGRPPRRLALAGPAAGLAVFVPHVGSRHQRRAALDPATGPSSRRNWRSWRWCCTSPASSRPGRRSLLCFREGLLPPLAVVGALAVLIAKEPDMGTALVLGCDRA